MDLIRLGKINLVEAVYEKMDQLLRSGQFSEGAKLPSENELCKQYCVSRVVVREALQKLRSEKRIITRQGMGTFVANPQNFIPLDHEILLTEQSYKDFLVFRDAVEITAVKASKHSATPEDYEKIERRAAEMENSIGYEDLLNLADYNFHLAIVEASHNDMLIRSFAANQSTLVSIFAAMNTIRDARSYGVVSHVRIAKDLCNKNVKAVVDAYQEMGKYNLARLQQILGKK